MPEHIVEISVVLPVFNEEPNLRELFKRLLAVLNDVGKTFEVVAVDDGSSDGSLAVLQEIQNGDSRIRIVRLSRNFGQSPALFAGFANARGAVVVTIDADLQNPPEEIPKLLKRIDEGYDYVSGWRQHRQDSALRRLPSMMLNRFLRRIANVKTRDIGCALKAFRREVIDQLVQFSHRSRYLPAEVALLGVRTGEVEVAHSERSAGVSKYGPFELIRATFDIITSVTAAPLQVIGLVGWIFALAGFIGGARTAYVRIFYGDLNYMGSVIAVILFLQGVHLISMGIVCEYISRIYVEVQNRPYFVVKEVIERPRHEP